MIPDFIIPPRSLMTQTSSSDPVWFHYYPLVGIVYRQRLRNTFNLMAPYRFKRLLEVGYGSGIFLPTLAQFSQKVWALDVHTKLKAVKRLLTKFQIHNVTLTKGNIMSMPYPKAYFDACVAVSTLEDMPNAQNAISELKRVVKKDGHLFISFPVANILTDSFFRIIGENPTLIHPSNYRTIIKSLETHFQIEQTLTFPKLLPVPLSLYVSTHCRNT